jgi:hypothetical protein
VSERLVAAVPEPVVGRLEDDGEAGGEAEYDDQ